MDLMKDYPDKYFDLAICDPPYGIGECGAKNHSRGKATKATQYTAKDWDNEIPSNEYFSELKSFCTAWEINPELANGRLHFHGFITFQADKYTKRIYAKWKAKLFKYGNIKACPVYYNLCRSMEYCRKDQADMQSRISTPVPYHKIHSLDNYRVYPIDNLLNTLLKNFD